MVRSDFQREENAGGQEDQAEDSSYNWEIDYVDMDYDEEADAYIVPEGWWETVDFCEEFSPVDADVTHWMPLPEPPKEGTP